MVGTPVVNYFGSFVDCYFGSPAAGIVGSPVVSYFGSLFVARYFGSSVVTVGSFVDCYFGSPAAEVGSPGGLKWDVAWRGRNDRSSRKSRRPNLGTRDATDDRKCWTAVLLRSSNSPGNRNEGVVVRSTFLDNNNNYTALIRYGEEYVGHPCSHGGFMVCYHCDISMCRQKI